MGVDKSELALQTRKPHVQFLVAIGFFLLSGLSSLIYQVIWTRMLVFVFGSTAFATSTVLAVFMGGLALGSYVSGKFADRTKNPFIWYGVLEGIIGVWALLAPFLFSAAIPIYKLFFESLHMNLIAFGILRFAVASMILLLPTTCMGATLPILSRFVTDKIDEVGDRVGSLYAVNTLGAVLGSLCAGFVLLPNLGLSITTLIAAATNISLGLAVFALSKSQSFMSKYNKNSADSSASSEALESSEPGAGGQSAEANSAGPSSETTITEPSFVPRAPGQSNAANYTIICIAISGALAMTYEVAWTRSLLMIIGSTTYAFTVMLSTFLIGIFLGSMICSKFVDKMKIPILWFALAEMLLCLAGFYSIIMFYYLPYFNVLVGHLYGKSPEISMLFRFVGAGIVIIPISLCLGFCFPVAVKVCARDIKKLANSVGHLYAMNTLGAIVGAFVSGFFVIPFLGAEKTIVICSMLNLLMGVVLLCVFGPLRSSIKMLAALASFLILILVTRSPQIWDYRIITVAQSERRHLEANEDPGSFSEWFRRIANKGEITFYKEGKTANVAIFESDGGRSHALLTNGHADASDGGDMENQAMLAVFPLLIKPAARDACVVGFGSGVTAGYALQFPLKTMVCAEIEPAVLETSKFFHKVNYLPENDSRAIIEPSDGRNYLLGTTQKFDAIISEPSNPWQAGVCNLFTTQYFQICRDSMTKNGVFTLWTQISEIPSKNLVQVFSSLHTVFPCIFVLDSGVGDVNAMAFASDSKIAYDDLKKSLSDPKVQACVSRFRLKTPEDFISRILAGPDGIASAVQNVAQNTDDTNHLEYDVAKVYENIVFQNQNWSWLNQHHGAIWDHIDWGKMSPSQKAASFVKVARASRPRGPLYSILWCKQSMLVEPNPDAQAFIAEIEISQQKYSDAQVTIAEGARLFPNDERFVGLSGIIALRQANYLEARKLFEKSIALKSNNNFVYFLVLTYSPIDLQELDGPFVMPPSIEPEKIIELGTTLLQSEKFISSKPAALLLIADAYKRLGKYADAEKTVKRLIAMAPRGYLSWQMLGNIYNAEGKIEKAQYCWSKASMITSADLPKFLLQARMLMSQKKDGLALKKLQALIQMAPASGNDVQELLKELAQRNNLAKTFYANVLTDAAVLAGLAETSRAMTNPAVTKPAVTKPAVDSATK